MTWPGVVGMDMAAVLERLAGELAEPGSVRYAVSPDGCRVAVLEWAVHQPRPRAQVQLLRYGRFGYDATRRAVAGLWPRSGSLTVLDTRSGKPLASPGRMVAGPPAWSPDGQLLAGLCGGLDGDGYRVWVLELASGACCELAGLRAACSLLGVSGGPGRFGAGGCPPLWWTADGSLIVARDAIDRDAIDMRDDIVAEPDPDGPRAPGAHHDLVAIFAAAQVDLVRVDPAAAARAETVTARCALVDWQIGPGGDAALAGVARHPGDAGVILTRGMVGYELLDLRARVRGRPLGRWSAAGVRWQPGPGGGIVAGERTDQGMIFRSLGSWGEPVSGVEPTWRQVELAAPVVAWLPVSAGGVVAIVAPVAAGAEHGGARRLVYAAPDRDPHDVLADCDMARGPWWLRQVPSAGPVEIAVGGPGFPERLVGLRPDDSSPALPPGLRETGMQNGQVLFLDGSACLVEYHDPFGWALWRRMNDGGDLLIHELAVPKPVLGPGHESADRPGPRWQGQPAPFAAYDMCLPPEHQAYDRPAVLVELRPLAGEEPPPVPRPRGAALPPVSRAHLAAGTAIVTLYVCLPEHAGFERIRDRLVGAVTEVRSELSALGCVDGTRLALAGHSFGAACAAVVIAGAPGLFRCAILRAGAYNRTLTPRGFHDEKRTLWQARDVYDGFTLVYAAPSISCPVLLLQGAADPNGVTDPLQAWAFYDALLAAGGRARLVLLYNEDHAFVTREGIVAAAREELTWMSRWAGHHLSGQRPDAAGTEEVR